MSAVQQRTRILIKDLAFQTKYHLSHTQMDLMAYFANLSYWATSVNGYYAITSKKIMSDMPQFKIKTLEATIKDLKKLALIETTRIVVKEWEGSPKVRGLVLTKKGKEYNKDLVLPSQDEEVRRLRRENKALKETIANLKVSIEPQTEEKESQPVETPTPTMPPEKAIDTFVDQVTKRFSKLGDPICNFVPTWNKESTFYINSYNKLAYMTPQGEERQLKEPSKISHFWHWLFKNPNRIGDKIDFSKKPTLKQLKSRYIDRTVKLGDKKFTINNFVEVKEGVKIEIRTNQGKRGFLIDSLTSKDKIFSLEDCQKMVLAILG